MIGASMIGGSMISGSMLPGGQNTDIYGVVHHYELSSPTLVRVGKMALHKSLPVQSRMRRCVLDDSGKVVYYLHPDNSLLKADGTPARLDGTDGMVMVEIPEHWRKCTDNTTDKTYTVEISLKEFPGAHKVNKCYYSAYEATVERGVNKLASVCSTDVKYRGGNNQSAWDGTYRSVLGKPATAISLTNGRTYAHNRGAGWQQGEWDIYNSICWLYYIEYASFYCQSAFNSALTAEGYHQGGLGAGVTNADGTKWNNYNGYYPFINCGHTNSLGNKTGIVPFSWNEEQAAAYGGALTTNVPSYRGIENPFGHIWKWHDGFLAKGDGTKQEYFLCHDRSRYASALNDAYKSHGLSAGANNYVKEFIRDGLGNILCKSVGGGSTTYMTDYHYEAFNSGTIYALFSGGNANNGANAGFACLASYYGPATTSAYIGLRLCWCRFNEITE